MQNFWKEFLNILGMKVNHAMDNEIHEARGMKPTLLITSQDSLIEMKSLTGNGRNQRRTKWTKSVLKLNFRGQISFQMGFGIGRSSFGDAWKFEIDYRRESFKKSEIMKWLKNMFIYNIKVIQPFYSRHSSDGRDRWDRFLGDLQDEEDMTALWKWFLSVATLQRKNKVIMKVQKQMFSRVHAVKKKRSIRQRNPRKNAIANTKKRSVEFLEELFLTARISKDAKNQKDE